MRTTIDIDDDVLHATRELARLQNKTTGQIVSELLRQSLTHKVSKMSENSATYGIVPFPSRGGIVTTQIVERLQDSPG